VNIPAGYERLLQAHAVAVARSDVAPAIRQALVGSDGVRSSLYDFAARSTGARPLQGRGIAYATRLPGGPRVVVRRNRHGGLFAGLTRDRFLSPTRAPYELETSITLRARGIPTPEILAFVLYPPGAVLQRADVASAEITGGRDLADVLARETGDRRKEALRATAALVAALSATGARHEDLNARNVLIAGGDAFVLDVDRVVLGVRADAALESNLGRLTHSLRKSRTRLRVAVSDAEIETLEKRARGRAAAG
jgi:tRNA A-37 threonylcarbamoyl transferase component Bud32